MLGWPGAPGCEIDHTNRFFIEFLRPPEPHGPGWAHELKHDGYRLQIHIRDGRVRLYTRNGADWSKRYPRIVAAAATSKAQPLLMLRRYISMPKAGRNSICSTAVSTITLSSPRH